MNTLKTLQALSDKSLIEKVAVEVMGWHSSGTPMQIGYDWGEWQDENDKFMHLKKRGTSGPQSLQWNPLTDWNHTMEVGKRIVKMKKGSLLYDVLSMPDPQRAICLAALLAVSA